MKKFEYVASKYGRYSDYAGTFIWANSDFYTWVTTPE
jgi:hypothetical protein